MSERGGRQGRIEGTALGSQKQMVVTGHTGACTGAKGSGQFVSLGVHRVTGHSQTSVTLGPMGSTLSSLQPGDLLPDHKATYSHLNFPALPFQWAP